jgi:hypothetical protein
MFTISLFIALIVSTAAAQHGDWARRHGSRETAKPPQPGQRPGGMLGVIALAAALHLAHSARLSARPRREPAR